MVEQNYPQGKLVCPPMNPLQINSTRTKVTTRVTTITSPKTMVSPQCRTLTIRTSNSTTMTPSSLPPTISSSITIKATTHREGTKTMTRATSSNNIRATTQTSRSTRLPTMALWSSTCSSRSSSRRSSSASTMRTRSRAETPRARLTASEDSSCFTISATCSAPGSLASTSLQSQRKLCKARKRISRSRRGSTSWTCSSKSAQVSST